MGPVAAFNSNALRPYVPTRNTAPELSESRQTLVQSTNGKPYPSFCQVWPRSLDCITPASLATMMVCGLVPGTIAPACKGKSGRFCVPPLVPLMSRQFAPLSVVRYTCWLGPGGAPENPS